MNCFHVFILVLGLTESLILKGAPAKSKLEMKTDAMRAEEYILFDEDLDSGERSMLSEMMKDVGISVKDFADFKDRNLTSRQKALWMVAAAEEGINRKTVSTWGKMIPKIPRSWVENIAKVDHTKIYKYMFSGSFVSKDVQKFRYWLPDFIKKHFAESDYFRATDAKQTSYTPLGSFDKTLTADHGFRPKRCGGKCWTFDNTYWQAMTQSKFTLCPGGDAAFSYRYYETFLAKTIPLINSLETDWQKKGPAQVTTINTIMYEHMVTENHTYDPEVPERNYAKFIRYQTFMQGDNVPPGAENSIRETIGHRF